MNSVTSESLNGTTGLVGGNITTTQNGTNNKSNSIGDWSDNQVSVLKENLVCDYRIQISSFLSIERKVCTQKRGDLANSPLNNAGNKSGFGTPGFLQAASQ